MVVAKNYKTLPLDGDRYFCFGVREYIFVRSVTPRFAAAVGVIAQSLPLMEAMKPIGSGVYIAPNAKKYIMNFPTLLYLTNDIVQR